MTESPWRISRKPSRKQRKDLYKKQIIEYLYEEKEMDSGNDRPKSPIGVFDSGVGG